jgi:hypothetical protein
MAMAKPVVEQAASYTSKISQVSPKDIMNTLWFDFGVESSYLTVWKALNKSKKCDSMEYDKSYMLVKDYMDKLANLKPGTVPSLEFEADGVIFQRAFISTQSNQLGFFDFADRW